MQNNNKRFLALLPLLVITVVVLAGIGTVMAAENSQEGDLLFPVKTTVGRVIQPSDDKQGQPMMVEDNSNNSENGLRVNNQDDVVNGVKLRGDGTVDDNSVSGNGQDDMVNGVKLRGDGTVDDNSPAGEDRDRGTNSGRDSN